MNKPIILAMAALTKSYTNISPITTNRPLIICTHTGSYIICQVKTIYKCDSGQPVLRTGDRVEGASVIAAVDEDSGEVWLIPVVDVLDTKSIRLGHRWDVYKYQVTIDSEEETMQRLEELKQSTRHVVNKVKGVTNEQQQTITRKDPLQPTILR